MPFSVFLMSVSQFLLATNWLLELDFVNKWKRLIHNKPALYLIGLFFLHLIWMFNSSNVAYGLHDIKIKLPLFVLALLVGSSKKLEIHEVKLILNFFILAVVGSSFISGLIYYGLIERHITDIRQISIFISHIRLSLLVNMAIFSSYYLARKTSQNNLKMIYTAIILSLSFFLFILNSYTGLLVFSLVFISMILRSVFLQKKIWLKWIFAFLALILIFSGVLLIKNYINEFYNFDNKISHKDLPKYTINGNLYKHNTKAIQIENGHYVYWYLCEKELEKEWNKKSNIPYSDGVNKRGFPIKYTLMNYLTSLNLTKDSVGVTNLANEDIKMIETAHSNYIYKNKYSPYAKVYPIIEQFYYYSKTGNASGASVTQRLEYLKIAKKIISNHFWFGTGTGDVDDAFKKHYQNGESTLKKEFQHRAHNQYVTFFISFGLFGFLGAMFFMFAPMYRERKQFLPLVFLLAAFLSMINEDTLETQAGITFFTYFYILFFIAFSFSEYQNQKSTDKIDA